MTLAARSLAFTQGREVLELPLKTGDAFAHTTSVDFKLHLENNEVVIRIEDNGIPFDPVAAPTAGSTPPLEKCKIGGLGLHIVKKMMDEIVYERRGDKNIITIKKLVQP